MKTFLYLFLIFYFSIMFTENLIINKFSVVCELQSPAGCADLANTFTVVVWTFKVAGYSQF